MNPTEKDIIERWQDVAFVASMTSCLKQLTIEKQPSNGLHLSGLVLGLDGEPELLSRSDFQDTHLTDSDLSLGAFSCAFSRCHWNSVKLEHVKFDTCRFKNAIFENCDIKNARFKSPILDDCSFTDCIFDGAIIVGRGFSEYGGRRISFVRCRFANADFKNLQIRASRFVDCDFTGSKFQKCLLTGTSFSGPGLEHSTFASCKLEECKINGKRIHQDSEVGEI